MIHFSARSPNDLRPNQLNAALTARRAADLEVLDLTLSNPTRAELAYPNEEILAALADPRSLTYEPTPKGLAEAREAIAAHHARHGQAADPEQMLLTGSTSEAYGWLFKLLCAPGDEILVPRPSYPLFDCLATLDAVRVVEYSLPEDRRWGLDFEALERGLSSRTRALVLVNPNNPTGAFLKRAEWLKLQAWATSKGIAIIADEVFADYAWTESERSSPSGRVSTFEASGEALVFTLSGLSKVAGLPQMKLGWMHVSGPGPLRIEALERLEWIADAYLPVSAPIQHAVVRWTNLVPAIQASIRARCLENLAVARTIFSATGGARILEPEGGWCVLIDVPRFHSEEEWALRLLARHGVLLQPGYFYDFEREALLVASLLPQPATFHEGLARLERSLLSPE